VPLFDAYLEIDLAQFFNPGTDHFGATRSDEGAMLRHSAAPSAPPTRRTGCFSNMALRGNAL
jgi:hypothetical protein